MPTRRPSALKASPAALAPAAEGELGEARFHISRYHNSRYYELSDGKTLVVVAVYKKGAEAVKARLEAQAQTIADLQRQIDELKTLTPRFREQATDTPRPPQQLPLLAAENMPTYRVTSPRRPAPRRS